MMKILLSAYACEPNKGSEPFLGWRWAREIAMHHDVWIITRANNKESIEEYLGNNPMPSMHFSYVDVGGLVGWYKKGSRGMQLYYYFWQRKAYKKAKELNKYEGFDIVHHLTFGAFTQPTYMWKLGIPFLWGPIGGGEKLPHISGRKNNFCGILYELLRSFQMNIYRFLPFSRGALKNAYKILVTTEETKNLIPSKYRNKCILFQSLGIDKDFMREGKVLFEKTSRIKVLVVGRMIGWKGFDIAIDAFKIASQRLDNVDLYLRGKGELKDALLSRCGNLLGKRIFYVDTYFNYEDMHSFYKSNDIFLNCSLHDSGCLVILEAMSAGLPIICINCGGPKVITEPQNAIKIEPSDYKKIVSEIADAICLLSCNKDLRSNMGNESINIINEKYLYEKKYNLIESIYKEMYISR